VVLAALRLLPMSDQDKGVEIPALRHRIAVLEWQLGPSGARFAGACAFLGGLDQVVWTSTGNSGLAHLQSPRLHAGRRRAVLHRRLHPRLPAGDGLVQTQSAAVAPQRQRFQGEQGLERGAGRLPAQDRQPESAGLASQGGSYDRVDWDSFEDTAAANGVTIIPENPFAGYYHGHGLDGKYRVRRRSALQAHSAGVEGAP
jgi:hypothetical protein